MITVFSTLSFRASTNPSRRTGLKINFVNSKAFFLCDLSHFVQLFISCFSVFGWFMLFSSRALQMYCYCFEIYQGGL